MTIEERVKKLIAEVLDADPEKVTPAASFIDDLGADSLDFIDLIVNAEEEFDRDITDDQAEQVKTVADAVALIERLVGGKVSP